MRYTVIRFSGGSLIQQDWWFLSVSLSSRHRSAAFLSNSSSLLPAAHAYLASVISSRSIHTALMGVCERQGYIKSSDVYLCFRGHIQTHLILRSNRLTQDTSEDLPPGVRTRTDTAWNTATQWDSWVDLVQETRGTSQNQLRVWQLNTVITCLERNTFHTLLSFINTGTPAAGLVLNLKQVSWERGFSKTFQGNLLMPNTHTPVCFHKLMIMCSTVYQNEIKYN